MKRVVVVALLLLVLATAATAAEDSWRINVKADNGSGMYGFSGQYGIYPGSSDLPDGQDLNPWNWEDALIPHTATLVMNTLPGVSGAYHRDIRAPAPPPIVFDFYVAGNVDYNSDQIRLMTCTAAATVLPTPRYQGMRVGYYIMMADNKGTPGAPSNGTRWDLPIPTEHVSTVVPYWTMPTNLPAIKLSAGNTATMFSEAYHFQLVQELVPEPSGLLALGSGMIGFIGYAIRRRKV